MQLNHLDIPVSNVAETRDLFVNFFGFRIVSEPSEKMSILAGSDDFILVLSQLKTSDPAIYPAQFHLGFILASIDKVYQLHHKLKESGIVVPDLPRENKRGTMFYFYTPGRIMIEISCPSK